ncbi:MAG: alpha/beta fold hydrolase, partial [Bacillota bacterium]
MKLKIILIIIFLIISLTVLLNQKISAEINKSDQRPFPESQFIKVDDIKYHYRVWQPERELKGKILLLHGFAGSTYSWRNNVKDLKEAGYQVIALDLPGFGYTERKTGLNHSQLKQAERIWNFLNRLESDNIVNPNKNWHLIGHSYGGGTAAAAAYLNQAKVQSLILISGALNVEERFNNSLLEISLIRKIIGPVIKNIIFTEPVFKRLLSFIYGEEPASNNINMLLEPLKIPGTEEVLLDIARTFQDLPETKFTDINIPILLIWGEEDNSISTPPEEGIRLRNINENAELKYIEKASHFPMESHPAKVNSVLVDWLN